MPSRSILEAGNPVRTVEGVDSCQAAAQIHAVLCVCCYLREEDFSLFCRPAQTFQDLAEKVSFQWFSYIRQVSDGSGQRWRWEKQLNVAEADVVGEDNAMTQ